MTDSLYNKKITNALSIFDSEFSSYHPRRTDKRIFGEGFSSFRSPETIRKYQTLMLSKAHVTPSKIPNPTEFLIRMRRE